MWAEKENTSRKRKQVYYEAVLFKKARLIASTRKRKPEQVVEQQYQKKQKIVYCVLHEEKCICDIYECSGLKEYSMQYDHMPYII